MCRYLKKVEELRIKILELTKEYYFEAYENKKPFKFGDRIAYAGRVFDENEIANLVDSSLEFWLTAGRYTKEFEERLSKFLNVRFCYACNSGSSANLLAFMALTSPLLGKRSITRGDEVITVAAGFPTTVTPIIQFGAIPVFVDVTIPQYNIDCSKLEKALSNRTKAVMIAHTLGNPFDLKMVKEFCKKNNLWLIEDNCDALGSMYFIDGKWKYTGTIGDIGTSSFYPPHHMTTGEGGAVYTDNPILSKILLSLRDWGRDCSCPSGVDNLCGARFDKQFGDLPFGYDHKYVYSHFGYNLKLTDMQAAIGVAQLKKLQGFIDIRKENWIKLYKGLEELSDFFILPEPCENSLPSWFGFLLTVKNNKDFTRDDIVKYLENNNVQTRMLFSGNIIKHPCFDIMRRDKIGYRSIGDLKNTDIVMNKSFWIGVYPGLIDEEINYMIQLIKKFVINYKGGCFK